MQDQVGDKRRQNGNDSKEMLIVVNKHPKEPQGVNATAEASKCDRRVGKNAKQEMRGAREKWRVTSF